MLSHAAFSALLDSACGTDKAARLAFIDAYDHDRRKLGLVTAAENAKARVATTKAKNQLKDAASKLKDTAALAKVLFILNSCDDAEKIRIAELLSSEKMKKAIQTQCMNEEKIRGLAEPYSTHEVPTGHLRIRRYLRKKTKQATALINMTLGLVGANGYNHCTPFELNLRNQQKGRWGKFGESTMLRRGNTEISMLDVMRSASKKKLAEVYALVKGLESYAKAAGLSWAFLTLTAPPRMHPNPANGKSQWDGTTPDDAHNWIHAAHHRAEARLRKHGIVISGLRVVEPHKDGCPHWHMLVFVHKSDMQTVEGTFRQQPEWKSEQGLKFVIGDSRATAASYCFKYVLKTINNIERLSGVDGTVDAWRSTWGIRSFQWFGMPRVQLWRDLRAVKECPAEPLLAGLWRAAHRGDGHAFIGLAGGLNVKTWHRPVTSKTSGDHKTKSIDFILQDTGEAIRFNFQKWTQQKNTIQPNKDAGVEVNLNYPRRSKTENQNQTTSPPAGQGMIPCTPARGPQPHSRPQSPLPIPPSPPVGRWRRSQTEAFAPRWALTKLNRRNSKCEVSIGEKT